MDGRDVRELARLCPCDLSCENWMNDDPARGANRPPNGNSGARMRNAPRAGFSKGV